MRVAPALALLAALSASGCKTPTEIVVRLDDVGGDPSLITVKLHRSTGFNDNAQTPPFVQSVLDGPDLDLLVMPQGAETTLSILPPPGGPDDLTISASAPGFSVDPPDPFAAMFQENVSQSIRFILTFIPPDMARDAARDAAVKDQAADAPKGG